MTDELWLSLEVAGERIRDRENLSVGAAAARLQKLCSTGEVRSVATINGDPYNLQPYRWQEGRLVDFKGERLGGTADSLPIYNVYINERDLEFALSRSDGSGVTTPTDNEGSQAVVTARRDRRSRGRRHGSGAIDDGKLVCKMLHLLAETTVPSVLAAARQLVGDAEGASKEAILHRLCRKFKRKTGFMEPPAEKTWADVERELNSNSAVQ